MIALRLAWRCGLGSLLATLALGNSWSQWEDLRPMAPIIVDRLVPQGIDFDADFEAKLASGKPIPLIVRQLLERNREHADTLSQPVGITGWKGDTSTWEVFFATNRELVPDPKEAKLARFGNDFLKTSPHYGRAEIAVPFRRRGVDPNRDASTAAAPAPCVSFDSVEKVEWSAMAEGLRSQVERSRQHDLLLFVHGFNVDFESALVRTAQLGLDLPFNGAIVAYCWPSQGGVGNYPADESINAKSVKPFSEFLKRLVGDLPPDTRINIVVHSMGNRLVMQGIGLLPASTGQPPIAHLVLCAPDVGVTDFKRWAPAVVSQCRRVTLYASRSDSALIASKRVHGIQRAGDSHPPVCLPGIETIDVSSVDFDLLLGHSYYGSNLDVLSDLFFVLKQDRPADERTYLRRESLVGSAGHYWQFTDHAPYIRCSWKFGPAAK